MNAQHTSGPWKLYRPHRESFWHVNQDGGPGYICDAPMYEHRAAECEANARLIAAAPDMLLALRRAALALAFAAEESEAMRDDYNAVSAAIAKATQS